MFFVGMNNVVIRNTVFAEKLPERFMAVLGVFGIIYNEEYFFQNSSCQACTASEVPSNIFVVRIKSG